MATVGKNVYFDVLDDIVDKYNNTWHSSIKMKPKDVTDDSFAEYSEESNKKESKEMCFLRVIHQIGVTKSLLLKNKEYCPLDLCD